LHLPELVGHEGVLFAGTVDHHRHEERLLLGHVVRTLHGELPFVPKVTLKPVLGVMGDNRNEEHAVADLAPDLLVPGVATAQLALIEKDLDTACAQRCGDFPSGLGIL
jgi:hypothetical protein